MVEWRDNATLADGVTPYFNDGTHVIRTRWGKVVSLHASVAPISVMQFARPGTLFNDQRDLREELVLRGDG
jgi:hypothetical protein